MKCWESGAIWNPLEWAGKCIVKLKTGSTAQRHSKHNDYRCDALLQGYTTQRHLKLLKSAQHQTSTALKMHHTVYIKGVLWEGM